MSELRRVSRDVLLVNSSLASSNSRDQFDVVVTRAIVEESNGQVAGVAWFREDEYRDSDADD